MSFETHYQRLGVAPTASVEELRKAWLKQARAHHPDFHSRASASVRSDNEREMQLVNEAWAVLSDPEQRRRYDDSLRQPTASGVPGPRPAQYDFVPYDDSEDEIDPRLLDDVGVAGTEVRRTVQLLPVLLFLGGLIGVVLGLVINLMFLTAVGGIGLALSVVAFLIAPLTAISKSINAERSR